MRGVILLVLGIFFLLPQKETLHNNSFEFGVIDDSYNVTSTGAYNHIIPIQVTPGVNGLQPSLALVYDSNAGSGNMGLGWSLSGLSKISRAGNNYAQNGKELPIQFTNDDTFLLDGQFLSCVKGTNGGYKSEYRTENETFSKIYAEGKRNNSSSPEYFVVKRPNGLTYTYGFVEESKLTFRVNIIEEVSEWWITKIEDINGNYITFEYKKEHLMPTIIGIEYFNKNNQEIGSVIFNYIEREKEINKKPINVQFVKGNFILNKNILRSIDVRAYNTTYKYYELKYNENYTFLKEIIERSDENEGSLRPTIFTYNDFSDLNFNKGKSIKKPYLNTKDPNTKTFNADINFDGVSEYYVAKITKPNLKLLQYVEDADGNYTKMSEVILENGLYNSDTKLSHVGFADINGDQFPDFYTKKGFYLNKGLGVDVTTTFGSFTEVVSFPNGDTVDEITSVDGILVPFNLGHSRKEDILLINNSSRKSRIYNYDGDSSSLVLKKEFKENLSHAGNDLVTQLRLDHSENALLIRDSPNGREFSKISWNNNSGNNGHYTLSRLGNRVPDRNNLSNSIVNFEDINLDGIDDLIRLFPGQNKLHFYFNGGDFSEVMVRGSVSVSLDISESFDISKIRFGNFINSGFKEVLIPLNNNNFRVFGLKVGVSNGSQFVTVQLVDLYNSSDESQASLFPIKKIFNDYKDKDYAFTDLDGDGDSDVIIFVPDEANPEESKIVQFDSSPSFINRLSSVEDGFENIVEVLYTTIKDKETYKNSSTNLLDPAYQYVYAPFVVVKEVNYTNGLERDLNTKGSEKIQQKNRVIYSYQDLITETNGRGLAGFHKFTTKELSTGVSIEKTYEYAFPLTGKLNKEARYDKDGHEFFFQSNKWKIEEFKKSHRTFKVDKISDLENNTIARIKEFNKTGIRYLGLLESTTIIQKEKDRDGDYLIKSKSSITYDYNEFGNITKQITDLGEKKIKKLCTYQHKDKKNTVSAKYRIGLLSREENIVVKNDIESNPHINEYYYNDLGQLVEKVREPEKDDFKHTTKFEYDDFGNIVLKKASAQGLSVYEKYDYDNDGRFLIKNTNVYNHESDYKYHQFYGLIEFERDVNRNVTKKEYDEFGNLKRLEFPTGEIITNDYSFDTSLALNTGIRNSLYQIVSTSNLSEPVKSYYDRKGRQVGAISNGIDTTKYTTFKRYNDQDPIHLGEGDYIQRLIVSKTSYDVNGNVAASSKPQFVRVKFPLEKRSKYIQPEGKEYMSVFDYDQFNRLIRTQLPDGNFVRKYYRSDHEIEVDPEGNERSIYYNSLGEINRIDDAYGNNVFYEYDFWGNTTSVKNSQNSIITEYDHVGRKKKTYDSHIGEVTYNYDGFDRVINEKTNGKREVRIYYDDLSRIVKRTTEEKTTIWTYNNSDYSKYIGGPEKIETLFAINNLQGSEKQNIEKFTYDRLGNIELSRVNLKGDWYDVNYEYDDYHRLLRKIYPKSGTLKPYSIRYNYINNIATSIIQEIEDSDGTTIETKLYEIKTIDAFGKVLLHKYGNVITSNIKYDPYSDQISSINSSYITNNPKYNESLGTSELVSPIIYRYLQNTEFDYDKNYNLNWKKNRVTNIEATYAYDRINRLKKYTINDIENKIRYDNLGNIVFKSNTGTYLYENDNVNYQLTSLIKDSEIYERFKYDEFGNVIEDIDIIKKDTTFITYNSFNKPIKLENKQAVKFFEYNSSNREVYNELRKSNGYYKKTLKPYADFEIVEEAGKTTYINYVLLNGRLIASHNVTNGKSTNQYYLKDHLGSIEVIVDDKGKPLTRFQYDPFGQRTRLLINEVPSTNSFFTTRGFTGHEHLEEFGYINAKGRFYNPAIGRFLNADPFIQSPLNLQSLNRYSYVLNNPLNLVDPSGFFFKKIRKAFKRAVRGVVKAVANIGRAVVEFHENVVKETERFVEKYGKQLVVVAVAAAITYFSAGTLAGFGAAMLSGAAWGAGIAASITAINGGSLDEIINAGFNGAISGATAAAAAYSIGIGFKKSGLSTNFGDSGYFAKGIAHGTSGGIQAEINGGEFENGFLSASISYAFTPLNEEIYGTPLENRENALQRIAFSSSVGAVTSYASGGNIMEGALTSGFIRAYNCESVYLFRYDVMEPGYEAWKQTNGIKDPWQSRLEKGVNRAYAPYDKGQKFIDNSMKLYGGLRNAKTYINCPQPPSTFEYYNSPKGMTDIMRYLGR